MTAQNEFAATIEADRLGLLLRYPFYGHVICQCELVPVASPNSPLACNDCRHIYLNEQKYCTLPPEDRLPVLVHEVLHIALRHAFRRGDRDEDRFNFAADAEIFALMRDDFPQLTMPGYREDWEDLIAEEIYELLPKKLPEIPPEHCYPADDAGEGAPNDAEGAASDDCDEGTQNDADGSDSADADGSDSGDADGSDSGGSTNGSSSSSGSSPGVGSEAEIGSGSTTGSDSDSNADSGVGARNTDAGKSSRNAKGKAPRPSFDADSEMFSRSLSTMLQIELESRPGRGNTAGNILRILEKISEAHVDWRSLLRQFLRECRGGSYRWLPPNRRFVSRGLYLPGRRQRMFRGVVALDTSGSTVEALPDFVGEVERLMRSFGKYELTVIECDAAIANVTMVSSDTKPYDWSSHSFGGGGGTDFSPVFEYIREKRIRPNVLLFFTDGDGNCPQTKPGYPVLWLLTEGGEPPVSWGFPVKMEGGK